jgi:hypothetical protein
MKHLTLFENFHKEDSAKMYEANGGDTAFTLIDFKKFFNREYSYISLDLSDKDIQEYLDENKGKTLEKTADLFSDYVLSQGLASEVQEGRVTMFNDFVHMDTNE